MPDPTLGPVSTPPRSDSSLSVPETPPVTPATSGSSLSSQVAGGAIQGESSSTTRPLSTRTITPQRTGMFAWFSKQFSRLINWCRGRSDQNIGERNPEPIAPSTQQRQAEAAARVSSDQDIGERTPEPIAPSTRQKQAEAGARVSSDQDIGERTPEPIAPSTRQAEIIATLAARFPHDQYVRINLDDPDAFHRAQEALGGCIAKIRDNIDARGMLRLPYDRVLLSTICKQINGQDSSTSTIMENVANGNVQQAAEVTKRILRSAFKNSITLDEWEAASQITDPAEKVEALRALIQRLPPQKQEIVRQVFELFTEISQHSEKNEMTSSDLGRAIGLHLCVVLLENPKAFVSADIMGPPAAFMIDHYAEVFTTGGSARPSVASWNSGEMPNTPRTSGTLLNPSDRERVPVEEQAQTSEPTAVLSAEDAALLQDMRIGIGSLSEEAQSQFRNMLRFQREQIDRSSDKESAILASAAEIANRLNAGGTTEEKRHGARLMLEHFDQLFPPT